MTKVLLSALIWGLAMFGFSFGIFAGLNSLEASKDVKGIAFVVVCFFALLAPFLLL